LKNVKERVLEVKIIMKKAVKDKDKKAQSNNLLKP
jgi:hypothetical protein